MKNFLKNNIAALIFVGICLWLAIDKCNTPSVPPAKPDTITVIKEIHHYHDSTIITKPTIVNKIIPSKADIPKADTNYSVLKNQYDSLANILYSKNIQTDSIKIDSIGVVNTEDTVFKNEIISRKWDYHFDIKERTITNTITLPPKLKNQVYIGGGLLGNELKPISGIRGGILLKNKKDQLYQIGIQKQFNYPIIYEASRYFKIKFHK